MKAEDLIRVVLADDQKSVRLGLRLLLEEQDGIEIAGEAYNAGSLLTKIASESPDMVLLDWGLPGMDPESLINTLYRLCPEVIIMVLSGETNIEKAVLQAGADGFISKASPPHQLMDTVQNLLSNHKRKR